LVWCGPFDVISRARACSWNWRSPRRSTYPSRTVSPVRSRPQQNVTSIDVGVLGDDKDRCVGRWCVWVSGRMLLSRDGHQVTIVERDAEPAPRSPHHTWDHWTRPGVTQFHQPHYLQSRGRIVLEEELPQVVEALEAAGAIRFNPLRVMPPLIADRTPRDGDDRFETITARRPVLEQPLAVRPMRSQALRYAVASPSESLLCSRTTAPRTSPECGPSLGRSCVRILSWTRWAGALSFRACSRRREYARYTRRSRTRASSITPDTSLSLRRDTPVQGAIIDRDGHVLAAHVAG
jgi:hypothetical protein